MTDNIGRLNCFRLWRIWNFMLLIALYIYIVYDSIYQYITFKKYSMDLGFGSNFSSVHMNTHLFCLIMGLTCLPFSLYCLLFFNGNYADDNIKVGKDTDNFKIHQENDASLQPGEISKLKDTKPLLWKRFKRHFLPYSFLMHYLSAICFLVPLPFLEAHQIHQRVLKPNAIWHTDLDFLFDPDTWHEKFTNNERWRSTWLLRPQYFNLIFCLGCLIFKYPGVFWACHKGFSFTFSFLIALGCIHVVIDFSTTSVLIRLASNPDFVIENLHITYLSPIYLMMLSIFGSSVTLVTFWCVFEFGFQQFLENLSRCRHLMIMQCDGSHDGSNLSDLTCFKRKHLYLRGYLPHLGALFGCAIGFGVKIPLFYAGISIIYQRTGYPLMLINLLVAIIFISTWFITWFGFTLKQNWRFFLPSCSKAISDITSTTIANKMNNLIQQQKLYSRDHLKGDQNTQVYACYHGMNPRLIIDESRLHNDDCYSEENDLPNNVATTNYVYLQSSMNPAINQLLNNIPPPQPGESPLMVSFNENIDSKNTVSESESSYDSASNIRNQIIVSLDPHFGPLQTLNHRAGVLQFTGNTSRAYLPEYIPLQCEGIFNSVSKLDNSLSGETNIFLVEEGDIPLKSNGEAKLQINQSVSLNRQNSNKKRLYGQRVTFKDEQLTDTVDCSPNNSEQSSNNTSSSDSGIDNNSKQSRSLLTQKSDLNNINLLKRSDVSTYDAAAKFIPSSNYTTASVNNTYFSFCNSEETTDPNLTMLNSNSHNNTITNELLSSGSERHALSYLSDTDQEQRLCSQV